MLNKIKNTIEKSLPAYLKSLDKQYALTNNSPLLFRSIREFVLRKGKRVRPTLFVIGYLGFAKKEAQGLYASALSLELLHDFMLVHDDIIDKSSLRRGKPAMHTMLNAYLKKYPAAKFNGQDLAIVIGDVMYAMALHTFLSIRVDARRKEKALKKLIEAALFTGSGEFIELLLGIRDIKTIAKDDIYKVYDLKTAYYTFACPLAMGAIVGGAAEPEAERLFTYGVSLGRAFQIKDDIIGMFSDEQKTGKSTLTDLAEAKKTILVWAAYQRAGTKDKAEIRTIMTKTAIHRNDLARMRGIITATGSLDYAKQEVTALTQKAEALLASAKIPLPCKRLLRSYSQEILRV